MGKERIVVLAAGAAAVVIAVAVAAFPIFGRGRPGSFSAARLPEEAFGQESLDIAVTKVEGDDKSVRIELSILLPEGVPEGRSGYGFRVCEAVPNFGSGGSSMGISWTTGVNEKNELKGSISIDTQPSAFDKLKRRKVDIVLGDLMCSREDGDEEDDFGYLDSYRQMPEGWDALKEYAQVRKGTRRYEKLALRGLWHISVPLDFNIQAVNYRLNQPIPVEAGHMAVKHVSVTPFSVQVTIEGKNYGDMGADSFEAIGKNGKALAASVSLSSERSIDTGDCKDVALLTFDKETDINEIAYISVNGNRIKLEQK